MRAGTLVYCRPCDAARPSHSEGRRWITCDRGHRQNSLSVGIMLSTDDEETPIRLVPPMHCRPAYQLEEDEMRRVILGVPREVYRKEKEYEEVEAD